MPRVSRTVTPLSAGGAESRKRASALFELRIVRADIKIILGDLDGNAQRYFHFREIVAEHARGQLQFTRLTATDPERCAPHDSIRPLPRPRGPA